MRILLDESLPKRLKKDLKKHFVRTVPEAGWQGKKNGELLRLMTENYDVFITADQNLQYQNNIRSTFIPIIVLIAQSNRYPDIAPLASKVLKYLKKPKLSPIFRIK